MFKASKIEEPCDEAHEVESVTTVEERDEFDILRDKFYRVVSEMPSISIDEFLRLYLLMKE